MHEYITLLATLEARIHPKKFDCFKCINKYGTRNPEKSERARQLKGCFDFNTRNYRIENIRYNSCVGNYTAKLDFYIDLFSNFEKGIMPFTGTLGDQPNKIIEVFQIIEVKRNEHLDQLAKEEKSKR